MRQGNGVRRWWAVIAAALVLGGAGTADADLGFHWWGGTAKGVASGGSDGDVHAHYGLRRPANNSAMWTCHTGANQR